ncbi:MAG TPA: DNA translocase FtsK 4TM domain-containing protein [Candidatus Saccharimonadales bacterium]|nr:DNA translocase FtsK 4TM domain-containing protein [Candidatus Saccharimonadales bacterium]
MAKKKKRISKAAKKKQMAERSLPEGFWPQVWAVCIAVVAILLVLALFGIGGPLPHVILKASKWAVGFVTYLLPIILLYFVVETFRAENNRLPLAMKLAAFVFAAAIAGAGGLLSSTQSLSLAENGQNGGVVGFGIDHFMLMFLDTTASLIVLVVLALVAGLYVVQLHPKHIVQVIAKLFSREGAGEDNKAVAEKIGTFKIDDSSIGEKGFKLNEGVPAEISSGKGRLSSFRNSIDPNQADEQSALTTSSDPEWVTPSLDLLEKKQQPADAGDVKGNAQVIKDTLAEFSIDVEMEGANIGPKVTQYTLKPPAGVKLTRITALETNLALNLAAQAIRIEAPIPGQRAVGIEVPNRRAADVRLHGILESKNWQSLNSPLSFAVGRDIAGTAVVSELDKMPHLMIAGQTGSGKSVMINTLLMSLLYHNTPADMKLILVDPKQVELTPYNDIPYLLTPVITAPEKCISALKWAVNEMDRRYNLLAESGQRNIDGYNRLDNREEGKMPYIIIVIDELADLMMLAARDVEALIVRLAQKARAVGIHLVLATQRPSVDVITGLIKANIPARIAFTVASQVDSRTILDQAGAEKLLGEGDMLMLTPQMNKPKRIQGAYITEGEVMKVTDYLRKQRAPEYDPEIIAQQVQLSGKGGIVMDMGGADDDMYKDAVHVVTESGKASASLLQRRLRVGYARAARLIEMMEEQGIVGPADGARPRDVLIGSADEVFGGEE